MKKITQKIGMIIFTGKDRIKRVLKDNSGQGAIDTAIIVLISVVLGALILAGLYALISGQVLPTLSEKITNMFNYSD